MNWKKVKVRDLRPDFVFSEAREYDFSEGYGDRWEIAFERTEEEEDNEEFMPMMNYIYECRQDLSEEQMKEIAQKYAITFVSIYEREEPWRSASDYTVYMALTGAGMDFSWDIAGAYVMQGCLPPLQFCLLPRFAGDKLTTEKAKILAACEESIRYAKRYLNNLKRDLNVTRQWLKNGGRWER